MEKGYWNVIKVAMFKAPYTHCRKLNEKAPETLDNLEFSGKYYKTKTEAQAAANEMNFSAGMNGGFVPLPEPKKKRTKVLGNSETKW